MATDRPLGGITALPPTPEGMTNVLLSIDPGLDGVGLAVIEPSRNSSIEGVIRALRECRKISTSPKTPLPERLSALHEGVREAARETGAGEIVVEWPRHEGQYGRHGKAQRAMVNRLYVGIGAVLAGARSSGLPVQLIKASGDPKSTRQALLKQAATQARIRLPETRGGNPREDEWDAIWIGFQYRSGLYTPAT